MALNTYSICQRRPTNFYRKLLQPFLKFFYNIMTDICEIYRQWLEILEGSGQGTNLCQLLLTPLRIQNVINAHEMQLIEARKTSNEKNIELFLSIMPVKGTKGLTSLSKTLKQTNNENILKSLIQVSKGTNFEIKEETTNYQLVFDVPPLVKLRKVIDNKSFIKWETKQRVGRYLEINCEYIAQFWKSLLPKSEMSNGYVGVQLLTNTDNKTGIEIVDYKDIFQPKGDKKKRHFKRIIIEADPGCGKSTYVNKLALDWATGDEYLRSIFDFVFLFELKRLTTIEDGFKCFLPKECHNFAAQQLDKVKNKVLIIFDGFDEMEQSRASFQYIQEILKKQKHPEATCIVTTRGSHIDRIPTVALERRIIITGFSREAADEFMIKQECPLPSYEERKVLGGLLQIPLFCAIYCYMRPHLSQEELMSQYKLIESLVKSCTNLHGKKVTQTTDVVERNYSMLDLERDTMAIGKFAMKQLDDISLNVIPTMKDIVLNTKVNSAELETVQLGLLIKKKCPTSEYLMFLDEYSFPHQMIAEYFAAQYVSSSIDVAQVDIKSLLHNIKIPFVQFLLRIYFQKWSTTSIYNQDVGQFLKEPKIFGTWACTLPSVTKEQLPIVRINFSTEENNSTVVEDVPKDIFEVFVNEPVVTKWKPEWWYWIEDKVKSKNETVMVFGNIDAIKGGRTTLNGYLESYSVWSLCELSKNANTFLNFSCEYLTEVSIPNENISDQGHFYSDLVRCINLRALNLAKCNLNKEFIQKLLEAISLSKFVHLEKLNLSDNEQVGQGTELFSSLSKCKLKELKLKQCKLRYYILDSFIDNVNICCFQELETFDISHNRLIGRNEQFFIALMHCKKMKNLNLKACSISIESARALIEGDVPSFSNIENLNLSDNCSILFVENFFTLLTFYNLTSLKLRKCVGFKNSASFVKQFSNAKLSNLKILDLSCCYTCFDEVKFFSALIFCSNLQTLKLAKCHLDKKFIQNLLEAISLNRFVHLESLDLSDNENVGQETELFTYLSKCKLKKLKLKRCTLKNDVLNSFINSVPNGCFQGLETFDISHNQLIGRNEQFFIALMQCKEMKNLNLKDCSISIESARALIEEAAPRFPNIENLNLSDNYSIPLVENFFTSLLTFHNLKNLKLQKCVGFKNSASFVHQFSNTKLSNLKILDLSSCYTCFDEVKFFSALIFCSSLQTLKLANCHLDKKFIQNLLEAISLNKFVHLKSLDLSDNENVGQETGLFDYLSKCKLKELKLKQCELSNDVLDPFINSIQNGCFQELETFDVSHNQKIGRNKQFFIALTQCKEMKNLNLKNCSIPRAFMDDAILKFSNIENLNLSDNS